MDKAYIVANEQQEREVLEKLEDLGALWGNGKNATNFIPFRTFPYVVYCNGDKFISWDKLCDLDVDKIIVYDGRKEGQMSEKYVVSQEFMNELNEWKDTLDSNDYEYKHLVGWDDLKNLPVIVSIWWGDEVPDEENNNRLIAIIRWVNGEDVFEVEKPKKWVVQSKGSSKAGRNLYVKLDISYGVKTSMTFWGKVNATRFDTKEEAQSWANSHQEVVEVKE